MHIARSYCMSARMTDEPEQTKQTRTEPETSSTKREEAARQRPAYTTEEGDNPLICRGID